MYTLRVTPTILNEWQVRCIEDVIPGLGSIGKPGNIAVSQETLKEIKADCEFMLDANGPDLYPSERAAYRAMLKQCKLALSVGPVETV
jgi:hypothetical protein